MEPTGIEPVTSCLQIEPWRLPRVTVLALVRGIPGITGTIGVGDCVEIPAQIGRFGHKSGLVPNVHRDSGATGNDPTTSMKG
jgi:hypothetical protein